MPIANCIVTPQCKASDADLIALWASESGQSAQHMTINILPSSAQLGMRYKVMATLLLPSLWSKQDISLLQTGLARALSRYYGIPIGEVQVITTLVDSAMVVEDGEEIRW